MDMKELEGAVKYAKEIQGIGVETYGKLQPLVSLAETVLAFKGALPEKNECEHSEDGECGCNYLGEEYPCQIEKEARNSTIDECHAALAGRVPSDEEFGREAWEAIIRFRVGLPKENEENWEGMKTQYIFAGRSIRSLLLERIGGK